MVPDVGKRACRGKGKSIPHHKICKARYNILHSVFSARDDYAPDLIQEF